MTRKRVLSVPGHQGVVQTDAEPAQQPLAKQSSPLDKPSIFRQVKGTAPIKFPLDWVMLASLIYLPRLADLNVFVTADEPLFLEQARSFARGLATGDYGLTLGIGYPAVPLAGWVAPFVGRAQTDLEAYAAGRLITVLLTGLLLLLMYGLAKSLFGRWPALVGMVLLVLDPYSLAYGRLLHIAAPLAIFMTLSGLATLLWLRESRLGWLVLVGLSSGLALLTKSTALLLIPMLGLMMLSWALVTGSWRDLRWWLVRLGGLIFAAVLAAAIFFILWPAMWVDPARALQLTFGKLFTDQAAGTGNLGLFWFGHFVEDPGPGFYPVAFLLKATPWLLVGLLLSLVQLLKGIKSVHFDKDRDRSASSHIPETLALWLFAVTYLIVMTLASKKSVRYMLPAFPAFYLLAGAAYEQVTQDLKNRRIFRFGLGSRGVLVPIVVGLLLFTFVYHPYYLTYYNPLLLGWRWAPQTLLVGWGEGLDRAAAYLNQRPVGRVATWYEWLLPIQYQGEVQAVVPQDNLITADHAVLYINQVQRDIPGPNIIHYFRSRRRPEHTVRLAGIDYAWVYAGPIAGFGSEPGPEFAIRDRGQFGDEARLLGYDLHPDSISGGDALIVTLFWQALSRPGLDRFVFVRLVDDRGHIWAKADSPPVMGLWPTTRWEPDMVIEDAHELVVPPGTPPGSYQLEVGLYDPASGRPLAATGQALGQGGGLLVGEIAVGWRATEAVPTLSRQTDIRLSDRARLIGYDLLPSAATTGDLIPVRLAWREAGPVLDFSSGPDVTLEFGWFREGQPLRQQQSTLPLPISQWGRRATLLSQHDVVVPPGLETGRYDLRIGLRTDGEPVGDTFSLGAVEITAPAHQFELPVGALPPSGDSQLSAEANQLVRLAGYTYQVADNGIDLNSFWQPEDSIGLGYIVFAQLLDVDNTVVAQSDHVPAGGQRPTTGWLPGEIVADKHRLNFNAALPEGTYQLITGWYNPLDGQRLSVAGVSGETVVNAIIVGEVTVP